MALPAPMSAAGPEPVDQVLLFPESVTGVRQEEDRSCSIEVQEQPLDEPGSPGRVRRGSAVSAGTNVCMLMGDLRRPRRWHLPALAVSVAINVVLLVCIAAVAASRRSDPQTPGAAVLRCRDGWIGYHGICYYVSREEASWESSQRHCSSLGASLAVLKREWEVVPGSRPRSLRLHERRRHRQFQLLPAQALYLQRGAGSALTAVGTPPSEQAGCPGTTALRYLNSCACCAGAGAALRDQHGKPMRLMSSFAPVDVGVMDFFQSCKTLRDSVKQGSLRLAKHFQHVGSRNVFLLALLGLKPFGLARSGQVLCKVPLGLGALFLSSKTQSLRGGSTVWASPSHRLGIAAVVMPKQDPGPPFVTVLFFPELLERAALRLLAVLGTEASALRSSGASVTSCSRRPTAGSGRARVPFCALH